MLGAFFCWPVSLPTACQPAPWHDGPETCDMKQLSWILPEALRERTPSRKGAPLSHIPPPEFLKFCWFDVTVQIAFLRIFFDSFFPPGSAQTLWLTHSPIFFHHFNAHSQLLCHSTRFILFKRKRKSRTFPLRSADKFLHCLGVRSATPACCPPSFSTAILGYVSFWKRRRRSRNASLQWKLPSLRWHVPGGGVAEENGDGAADTGEGSQDVVVCPARCVVYGNERRMESAENKPVNLYLFKTVEIFLVYVYRGKNQNYTLYHWIPHCIVLYSVALLPFFFCKTTAGKAFSHRKYGISRVRAWPRHKPTVIPHGWDGICNVD